MDTTARLAGVNEPSSRLKGAWAASFQAEQRLMLATELRAEHRVVRSAGANMWRLTLVIAGLLVLASPAQASDDVLAALPGVVRISAHGGWVAFSVPSASGGWALQTWHDGVVSPVGVADKASPFDVDVGPDDTGRPTAVYSRCRAAARRQRPPLDPVAPRGCDLFAVTLGVSGERRLSVSSSRYSEFAPSIWRDALVFGRRSTRQRKADIYLARPGRPLKNLGPGTLAWCRETPCRDDPSTAWPVVMDLGPEAVAYNWQLSGGDTFLGQGTELRVARRDGSRARIADSGWSAGECDGSGTFSPNVSGTTALYGYRSGSCPGAFSFRRFDLRTARRFEASRPVDDPVLAIAWDGSTVFWLRGSDELSDCRSRGVCQLMRSRDLGFAAIRGGAARPPI